MNAPSPSTVRQSIPTGTGAPPQSAAMGPIPEPVSAAANPAPVESASDSAEARGRRILSTAYVRVGPDGYLTVRLHNGTPIVLRNVVVGPETYCGTQSPVGTKYCGGFADVAAAAPGGGPLRTDPDVTIANPLAAPPAPTKRD